MYSASCAICAARFLIDHGQACEFECLSYVGDVMDEIYGYKSRYIVIRRGHELFVAKRVLVDTEPCCVFRRSTFLVAEFQARCVQ